MTDQDEEFDLSKFETISAEELAATRHQAIRDRLAAGPKDWLHDFIIAMQDVFESQSVDDALNAAERERAEAKLETLRNQAPALIHLLEGLPSPSRDGACSIVFNLLAAVRSPVASSRGQSALEAKLHTKVKEVADASKLVADDAIKTLQKDQAAKGTKANSAKAVRKQSIVAHHKRLPHKEALPFVNADLEKHGYEAISLQTLYKWWPKVKAKTNSHS